MWTPYDGPTRREWLRRASGGFGALALNAMLADLAAAGSGAADPVADPLAPRPPHFPARAKRVIFLYMSGGVSHVDSFDPKPRLVADGGAGKTIRVDNFQGKPGDFSMYLKAP